MKTPQGSLCDLIASKFGFTTKSDEFYSVFAHTMSYLTRGIGYSEYQDRLKPFCEAAPFSAKDFRLMLHQSQYLSLIVKLYTLRLGKSRSVDKTLAQRLQRSYGLHSCDAAKIWRFWNQQQRFRSRIKQAVKEYDADTHLNPKLLQDILQRVILKPVSKYIKSFTYRKLRFICKSQNLDLRDLHTELTIKAVDAYYKLMPCVLEGPHVINYIKRAIHNSGINLISANTSQKAGRLINNDETGEKRDAFTLLVVSENQMRISAESDPVSYEELAGHNPIERVEIEHSVEQLVSGVKEGSKKHKFLTILMGSDDEEFTKWLRCNKHCSNRETNSDLQVRMNPNTFNILLGRFLRVDQRKVDRFITSLKTKLDPTETLRAAA
jgi:hypothetical protein